MLYMCEAYWEYSLSLTTGWTWGYGAAAALPPLDYQIQQPLTHTGLGNAKSL